MKCNFITSFFYFQCDLLVFDLGSLGPSTVTFIALVSVATCGGCVCNIIVNVKLLPEKRKREIEIKNDINKLMKL